MKGDIARLFDLRRDQAEAQDIDDTVRASARFAGTNLWVLFFAILVASVGLNVNSTAVIIGAMLISPLMGPIIGVGYGAAVNDAALIRTALKNLAVFTVLSLLASMVYFRLSPLSEPGTELLARTTPTLWDVLIATFGGAAGMVALTRKSVSNVVPGVAIATALMPPLCTAGFGLAHGRWEMFGGAFYLFLINGVFIAAATLGVSKVLRLPPLVQADPATVLRNRAFIWLGLVVVMVPSVWLGWQFVQQAVFVSGAQALVREVSEDESLSLVGHDIDAPRRLIVLTVVGSPAEQAVRQRADALLAAQGLSDGRLVVRRAGASIDVAELRREVSQDLTRTMAQQLAQQLSESEARSRELQAQLAEREREAALAAALLPEVEAQIGPVLALTVARGQRMAVPALRVVGAVSSPGTATPASPAAAREPALIVLIESSRAMKAEDRERLARWLRVRLGQPVELIERVARTPR